MKTRNISFYYTEAENVQELTPDDRELIRAAQSVAVNAYAPYSGFRVGAAVRLESGALVSGANVENAAYPSGICAERNALSTVVANHSNDKPVAIAIAALNANGPTDDPVTPCGTCRQVIAEEESRTGNQIRIILSGRTRTYIIESIGVLLPMQFNKDNLDITLP